MPHNLSSELTVVDSTAPSKMNIKVNASSDAEFHVLVTDYGKHKLLPLGHMFIVE